MPDPQALEAISFDPQQTPDLQAVRAPVPTETTASDPPYGRVAIEMAGALSLGCFLAFQQVDMLHTAGIAMSLLRGHLRDFYDYYAGIVGPVNYLPSTYWLYGLLALPIKWLHLLPEPGPAPWQYAWYFKAFNTLIYLGTALHVRAIALRMHGSPPVATFAAVLWLTTPVAFFSQFIFGGYDILTLFIFMWALRFYIDGRLRPFTTLIGVALTFKYFPVFSYFPLLLLAERRINRVLMHSIAVFIPIAVESFLYRHLTGFQDGVFGFGAASFIFRFVYDLGGVQVSMVFFVWFSICAYAWLCDPDGTQDEQQHALFISLAGLVPVFVLSKWHPQWAICLTPFMCLVASFNASRRRLMAIDVLMALAFFGYACSFYPNNVDHRLWTLGVFGAYNPNLLTPEKTITMLPPGFTDKRVLFSALFHAILLAYVCMSWPWATSSRARRAQTQVVAADIRGLWARFFISLSVWIVLAGRSYVLTLRHV